MLGLLEKKFVKFPHFELLSIVNHRYYVYFLFEFQFTAFGAFTKDVVLKASMFFSNFTAPSFHSGTKQYVPVLLQSLTSSV